MSTGGVEVGDIVQLDPERTKDKELHYTFMVVTKIEPWGLEGYIQGIGTTYYHKAARGTYWPTGGKVQFKQEKHG